MINITVVFLPLMYKTNQDLCLLAASPRAAMAQLEVRLPATRPGCQRGRLSRCILENHYDRKDSGGMLEHLRKLERDGISISICI